MIRRSIVALLVVCAALTAGLIYLDRVAVPLTFQAHEHDADIRLSLDRGVQLFGGYCNTARWHTENISAIYLNEEGHIGTDSQELCAQTFTWRVNFRDGTSQEYVLESVILFNTLPGQLVILALVMLLFIAVFLTEKLPDSRFDVWFGRIVRVVGFSVIGAVIVFMAVEVALRQGAGDRTYYNILSTIPDRHTGWVGAPGLVAPWRGMYGSCNEFDTMIELNTAGYHDDEWTVEKPAGTARIAVIGDSFVEAFQVPMEKTAVHLLEAMPGDSIEVMNFGTSGYSVAQYLMAYQARVRRYQPDIVFILAAEIQMQRTVETISDIAELRPTYRLDEAANLVYVPPQVSYEEGLQRLEELIPIYGEDGVLEIRQSDLPKNAPASAFTLVNFLNRGRFPVILPPPPPVNLYQHGPFEYRGNLEVDIPAMAVNYRIIEELNTQVNEDGGKLVLVDYFDTNNLSVGASNRQLMERLGAGYVSLSAAFRQTQAGVRFGCDQHFNEEGNAIFARVMFEWLKANTDLAK